MEVMQRRKMRGATLLHIDAHDDMAEPQSIPGDGGYNPASARIGNDEFILYGALTGFITQVTHPAGALRDR